ncbi:DedA family protein [Aureimonas jatrophae]|uniref:Membrane protein DedA, SNARE-associated domain n=1 Tax=Aureimonas jatrophae TaxID=1166073 RepID=A0A1H0GH71_9HYPH|nr:DedA family protein [Aureimonas jatrophae]MBB3949570.1 membrane protein DedA with SNARE-associated domain [Aureimonas jatrophae]SDO06256.1 membrane protein DedA, SNARE-associated domain [Aureimonas jatrophae]
MYEILGLIDRFGPIIVFIGTFFEGEVFAIIGGFLAYRGTYPWQLMATLALIGSFCGDLAVFLFSRYFSDSRWVRRWTKKPKFAKALRLVDRFQAYFVIVNRYVYGLRVPGLIALGLSSISVRRFLVLNAIGAFIWAGLFTTIGYVFGYSITGVFARLEQMEHWVMVIVGVLLVLLVAFIMWQQGGSLLRDRLFRRDRCDEDLAPSRQPGKRGGE